MAKANSMKELEKIINGRLDLALKLTAKDVSSVIQKHINQYYTEKVFTNYDDEHPDGFRTAIPSMYERTYQFLNSLITKKTITKDGRVSYTIGIDTESLNYNQDADVVIDMILRGFHADPSLNEDGVYETKRAIRSEGNFYQDAMEELGWSEGILKIMKKNCKKAGLNIR